MPKGIGWTGRWGIRPVVQRVEGGYRINLGRVERQVVVQCLDEVRALVTDHDPSTRRLFPTAHVDDPALEADYRSMVGDDLVQGQIDAIDLVQRTADGATIDRDGLEAWMRAINSVRLVIGTRLDISEEAIEVEPDDPDLALYAVYDFLSGLLGIIVTVLAQDEA